MDIPDRFFRGRASSFPMNMPKRFLAIVSSVLLLTGCISPGGFGDYYRATVTVPGTLAPFSGECWVLTTEYPSTEESKLIAKGYVQIGVSEFEGPAIHWKQIEKQGERVQADHAIFYGYEIATRSGVVAVPIYQPGTTQTTTTTGTINTTAGPTLNTGGIQQVQANTVYSGVTTTTTPGTYSSTVVPYSIKIYRHRATFWRKLK
jgi:hypothetical protein